MFARPLTDTDNHRETIILQVQLHSNAEELTLVYVGSQTVSSLLDQPVDVYRREYRDRRRFIGIFKFYILKNPKSNRKIRLWCTQSSSRCNGMLLSDVQAVFAIITNDRISLS